MVIEKFKTLNFRKIGNAVAVDALEVDKVSKTIVLFDVGLCWFDGAMPQ